MLGYGQEGSKYCTAAQFDPELVSQGHSQGHTSGEGMCNAGNVDLSFDFRSVFFCMLSTTPTLSRAKRVAQVHGSMVHCRRLSICCTSEYFQCRHVVSRLPRTAPYRLLELWPNPRWSTQPKVQRVHSINVHQKIPAATAFIVKKVVGTCTRGILPLCAYS